MIDDEAILTGLRKEAETKLASINAKHGIEQPENWGNYISGQTARAIWPCQPGKEPSDQQRGIIDAGIAGIEPKDSLEDMIAAQMLACHDAAMECYRLALNDAAHSSLRREYLTHGGKLSRTYAMLLDTLNLHRGKGQQKITVEHVHVHAGGQAVVGVVEAPGGGVKPKPESLSDNRKMASVSRATLRSEAWDAVLVIDLC
jgi:hypothetical protein